jgi:hypothetical protein
MPWPRRAPQQNYSESVLYEKSLPDFLKLEKIRALFPCGKRRGIRIGSA